MASAKLKALEFAIGVRDNASSKVHKVQRSIENLTKNVEKSFKAVAAGGVTAWGSARSAMALLDPGRELNRSLGELKNLDVGGAALDKVREQAQAFAAEYGGSAAEVVAATADVKRAFAGLRDSDLGGVATSAALLGKATQNDSKAVAGYLAGLRKTYAAEAAKVGDVSWIENLTGQTAAALQVYAGTSLEGYQKALAALGKQKVALPEQMAVLGVAMQSGLGDDAAGAAYKKSLAGMDKLGSGLGVAVRGENGELLAMDKILANIRAKHKGIVSEKSLAAILGDKDAAKLMYGLQKNQKALARGLDVIGQNKGLSKAAEMAGNLLDPLDQAGGAARNVAASLGQKMMPAVNAVAGQVSAFLNQLNQWINEYPNLTRWIGIGIIAILGTAAAMGTLSALVGISKIAMGGFGAVVKLATGGLGLLGNVTKAYTAIQWLLNAALWGCPLVWIVGIIALVIGAVVALVRWWDKVVAAFKNTAWGRAFLGIVNAIGAAIGWLVDAVGNVGEFISDVFGAIFDFIMAPFRALARGVMWILEKLGIIDDEVNKTPAKPSPVVGPGPLGTGLNYSTSTPAQLEAARTENVPEGGVNKELGKVISQNATTTDQSTNINEQHIHIEQKLSSGELEEMLVSGA